ncbi:DNA endonuclease SmrA [Aeromonas caviae]|uniref:DNA endonuclease SmrA n=1 Tax=Aeromonas caviae TaxID=648 RepID=UPI001C85578E|nr:DNA endonuclease SmrA [Aeromonas caviae]
MSHNDELSLFLQEVADVRPLRSDHIVPVAGNSQPTEAQLARREAATAEQLTLDHLGTEAVEMLDPHAIVGFKRDGVQEGVYKKLRLGKYELQGSLDLHHKTLNEARIALVQFIAECEVRDIRCLLILHGKGERSTPRALLKSHVSAWLPQLPSVMAMHSAERRHGGSGALYVLLRKSERKKAENRERHQKRLG